MPKARQEKLLFLRIKDTRQRRLLDFAALVALVCTLVYVGTEAVLLGGMDYRGYYAAARAVLLGQDPYNYDHLSQILLQVTGWMGNNPYFYPPWLCLLLVPLALLPFQASRMVWIALTLGAYTLGARLALDLLDWPTARWQRRLVILGGTYLWMWISIRSEQLAPWLFAATVLSLWCSRQDKPRLAGVALAMTLSKPNVTWLCFGVLWLWYGFHQRKAAWWALGTLLGLVVLSSCILPGWWRHVSQPGFSIGLESQLDGPRQTEWIRLSTTLRDWLGQWKIAGALYWLVWSSMLVGSGWMLWLAWKQKADPFYLAALSSALGLLTTPYALQYDYPPLTLALFWCLAQLVRTARPLTRWLSLGLLAFIASVPLWERPVYDGYWMLLGITALLILLNPPFWPEASRSSLQTAP